MSKKVSIDHISFLAKNKNCQLVSTNYVNNREPLVFNCEIHGNFHSNFLNFARSLGCQKCSTAIGSQKQKLSLEDAKKSISDAGYIPLFTEYNRAKDKLLVECPKHGQFYINISNIKSGKRCHQCGREEASKANLLSIEEVKRRVEGKNLIPLFDEYRGHESAVKVKCPIHGEMDLKLQNVTYGHGCPKCAKGRSRSQDEIFDFVKSFYPNTACNVRDIIHPQEIDIYIPELKLGIEYCGLYWHSDKYLDQKYHRDKMLQANQQGIRLITIFEDEWLERQDQVKGFLRSALLKNTLTVYARKCKTKEIDSRQAKEFLEQEHIQGKANAEIYLGLFQDSSLLGVISGNKHHRQGHSNIFVLNRLAFKTEYNIPGGSSKLFKSLISYAKTKNYDQIISWSDNRWSEGNVYRKLGFILEEELGPDYSYVKREERFSKQSNKKANLLKKGALGTTEREMALSLGLYRIWDCGKKRWGFNL